MLYAQPDSTKQQIMTISEGVLVESGFFLLPQSIPQKVLDRDLKRWNVTRIPQRVLDHANCLLPSLEILYHVLDRRDGLVREGGQRVAWMLSVD